MCGVNNYSYAKGNYMKKLTLLLIALMSAPAVASEYLLDIKEQCSSGGSKLVFECKHADDEKYVIFSQNNKWHAKVPESGAVVTDFKTLRNDKNIIILESYTSFSGHRTLYIYKKNKRFNVIEVAYSDILKDNETTIKQGTFVAIN